MNCSSVTYFYICIIISVPSALGLVRGPSKSNTSVMGGIVISAPLVLVLKRTNPVTPRTVQPHSCVVKEGRPFLFLFPSTIFVHGTAEHRRTTGQ